MNKAISQHARNLVVMLTAGGALDDVLEMARAFGVRAVHVDQLAVPDQEHWARLRLLKALKPVSGEVPVLDETSATWQAHAHGYLRGEP